MKTLHPCLSRTWDLRLWAFIWGIICFIRSNSVLLCTPIYIFCQIWFRNIFFYSSKFFYGTKYHYFLWIPSLKVVSNLDGRRGVNVFLRFADGYKKKKDWKVFQSYMLHNKWQTLKIYDNLTSAWQLGSKYWKKSAYNFNGWSLIIWQHFTYLLLSNNDYGCSVHLDIQLFRFEMLAVQTNLEFIVIIDHFGMGQSLIWRCSL